MATKHTTVQFCTQPLDPCGMQQAHAISLQ